MRQKSVPVKEPAEQVIKNIRRATRRQFSAEEKIRIVRQAKGVDASAYFACSTPALMDKKFSGSSDDISKLPDTLHPISPSTERLNKSRLELSGFLRNRTKQGHERKRAQWLARLSEGIRFA